MEYLEILIELIFPKNKPMKKLCILTNTQWVWGNKLKELQEFWKPVEELKCDIFLITEEIPFEPAQELVGSFMPQKDWYRALILKYPNYDEYLLVVSPETWKGATAQGWIIDGKLMSIST